MADMIYNGVELPDIDAAWTNQSKYPYAAITYAYSSDGLYELWLSSEPFLVRTYSGSEAISLFAPESYNVDYQRWRVLIGDWVLMDSSTVWANNSLNGEGNLVYATYDVYDTAENLYLAGSTHTGGSGGDGGDTGGGGDSGDTHTHSFIPTTIDPTCTESGYVIYECDCGSSYRGDDIPATGHQWDGNTCTVCGVTRTVRHSNVIDFFAGLMMGQRIKKIKNAVAKATQYLYGTPSESGNIGLRVGDSVTYYDGAVLPDINGLLTAEQKAKYPFLWIYDSGGKYRMYALPYVEVRYIQRAHWFGVWSEEDSYITALYKNGQWGEVEERTGGTNTFVKADMWKNFDLYYEDELLSSASPDSVSVSGLVGYSYNGAIAPELPVSDLPYAYIQAQLSDNRYVLRFVSKPIKFEYDKEYCENNGISTPLSVSTDGGNFVLSSYLYYLDRSEWELSYENHEINGVRTDMQIIWSNFDYCYFDGEVYCAASKPIPVYE